MKNSLKIILCLLVIKMSHAQSPVTLKIGDTVPNITLQQLVNYSKNTATLSEFTNQLVILDFWSTSCGSCVGSFPHLFMLQKEFKGKFKILLVNSKRSRDTKKKIIDFFAKRKEAYIFPSVIMDTILTKTFPHRTIPHYIWIFKKKVVGVTSGQNSVNKEALKKVLNGNILQPEKEIKYNSSIPLFKNGNGGKFPNPIYHSFITKYVSGLRSSGKYGLTQDYKCNNITETNTYLIDLYKSAYTDLNLLTNARIVFNVPNKSNFERNNDTNNLYNYSSSFPPCTLEEAKSIMQLDLKKYFGFKVKVTISPTSCWVLTTIDSTKSIERIKTKKSETNITEKTDLPKYLINKPIQTLCHELELIYKEPFINASNIKTNITLQLPNNILDIIQLQKKLNKQGLRLSREIRNLKIAIISKN